ncbi:sulfotransferase 1E1-like [Musca vetustissima]|uniref:sulfotransferase 1E1-like n=1 Tax=Musca vetustissima TaxID=27455 RepID=UPI002AB6D16A|nr:sulfotransferase 1E1-like [Musca vetustissima]
MIEPVEVKPKSYPTNLLPQEHWDKRVCYVRGNCEKFIEKIHDVEVYDDDVWIVTLPKCGTTWMQELLWLVINDYDFETAKNENLEIRSPFMEFDYMVSLNLDTALKRVEDLQRPRLVKSHLALPLLPAQIWEKKPKVIYVARSPKDAFVSEYHFFRHMGLVPVECSLEQYIKGRMYKIDCNEQFDNMYEFYKLRNEPWIYYTSFEQMKTNLPQVILDVCKFLGKSIDDATMEKMLKHLSFAEMKKNPRTNHLWEIEQVRKVTNRTDGDFTFCRQGETNSYKKELSPELVKELDDFVEKKISNYGLTLDDLLLLNGNKN